MTDLDRLDALAAAATPGPWTIGFDKGLRNGVWSESTVTSVGDDYDPSFLVAWCHSDTRDEDDAAFIAACDPATIRSLVAENKALREIVMGDEATKDSVRLRLLQEFRGSGSYNRTAIWQGIDRALNDVFDTAALHREAGAGEAGNE